MYLKKLEIQGFKSFAKKTVLEFQEGITSVVGPNGSGKSNLADALRWAFGEQSMKLLRGKKSEDVIFAGSSKKSQMGLAEVMVYFDNKDGRIPLDYSEVVIGRRLYRDGTSEYLINNSQVRLLDVQDLLSGSGFGNVSYHVIGQGMIDQLILGGPAAAKEIIEEAAGIKPYYIKRNRAIRRLERTETNLDQVKALIREIEPRLRSLRRQTKRLEKREEVEQELKRVHVMYFAQLFRGIDSQLGEVESKLGVFDKQLSELDQEIGQLSGEIEQEELGREGEDKQTEELRQRLAQMNKERQNLLEELATLRGKLKAQQLAPANAPEINWDKLKKKLTDAYGRFRELLQGIGVLKDEPDKWQQQAEAVGQMFESVLDDLKQSEKTDSAKDEREQDEKRQREVESKLAQLAEQITGLEDDIKQRTEKEGERKKQLFVRERLLRNKQDTLLKTRDQKNTLSIEQAKLSTRRETYGEEAREALGSDFAEQIDSFTGSIPADVSERIVALKKDLERIGGVDDLTRQEHKETEERYEFLTTQLHDLEKAIGDLKAAIKKLDEVIKVEFDNAFRMISEKFSEYFRMLFAGGKATMFMVKQQAREEDEEEGDVEQETKSDVVGIQINATPPGKKLSTISALSGGERALTAIAFLSALLAAHPSPFVVLDEVDAALDEANSIRFGKILGQLAVQTQFITITHNRETMRQSHTLYGVTMSDDGVSHLLSLKLEEAAVFSSKN